MRGNCRLRGVSIRTRMPCQPTGICNEKSSATHRSLRRAVRRGAGGNLGDAVRPDRYRHRFPAHQGQRRLQGIEGWHVQRPVQRFALGPAWRRRPGRRPERRVHAGKRLQLGQRPVGPERPPVRSPGHRRPEGGFVGPAGIRPPDQHRLEVLCRDQSVRHQLRPGQRRHRLQCRQHGSPRQHGHVPDPVVQRLPVRPGLLVQRGRHDRRANRLQDRQQHPRHHHRPALRQRSAEPGADV